MKNAPLKTRSTLMPMATPITPRPSHRPKSREKNSLAAIVREIETNIVNFTSPAARRPFPSGPANGYASPLKILFISTSQITSDFASAEMSVQLSEVKIGALNILRAHAWPITVV